MDILKSNKLNYSTSSKKCPFCNFFLRKERIFASKEYKLYCFRCKYSFKEIGNRVFFTFNGFDITIDINNMIVKNNDTEICLNDKFDVYNDIESIISKIETINTFE